MRRLLTVVLVCFVALLAGAVSPSRADTTGTELPFSNNSQTWLAVDPIGQHVFVSGGPGTSSIVVLDYAGNIVKTITGEPGASEMAINPWTHALYVALHDSTAIGEIDTQTLTETARFSTYPYLSPMSLALAGGKLWFSCEDQLAPCVVSMNLDGSDMADPGLASPYGPVFLTSGGTNNHLLATTTWDSEPPNISVYDVSSDSPTLVKSELNPTSGVGSFSFVDQMALDEPDGANLLIAAGNPDFVDSLSSTTFAPSFEYPTGAYPDSVAVSPDGNYVAAGRNTGTGSGVDVYLFPTGDTTPVTTWTIGNSDVPARSIAYSPDGSLLFALAEDDATGFRDLYVLNVSSTANTEITSGPDSTTSATSATFAFSSDDSAATFQCSLDFADWSACTSPTTYSGLAPGTHTFRVRAVNEGVPDPIGASRTWIIENAGSVSAELQLSANPLLTGEQVTLDASSSRDSPGNIVDYQWDLGNGSFDQDTGSTPTVSTSFNSPGPELVSVKVTDDLGASAVASATADVRLAPPHGPVGVSLDNGDYATNSTGVQLKVTWPAFAEDALISNDGGFGPDEGTKTVPVAATIPWTLASDGSERLPQIVYLRFPDSANPTVTFTDDIVLDTTSPAVASATVLHGKGRLYKVRLRARESISGISQVRLSSKRSGGTVLTLRDRTARGILKLSRTISVRLGARPKWVQARSAAGNWSKWHRVR